MNILMSAAPYGSTAWYLTKAFRELGHTVHISTGNSFIPTVDVIVGVDGVEGPSAIEGIPYIYWDTDSFLHPPVTTGTHLFIGGCPEDLVNYPAGTIYLPHAADPELHRPMYVEKEYDIVMVGATDDRYGERIRLLKLLSEKYKVLVTKTRPGLTYSQEVSKGKIIFNRSLGDKNIPMRFFEGMAIGCLVTNYNKNLDSLAQHNYHYLGYTTDDSLLSAIETCLRGDSYKIIAQQSRDKVLQEHTYKHRALTLLSCLN